MSDQDRLVDQFVNLTSTSRYLAEQYLARNKNNLENAIEDYYANPVPSSSTNERKKPKGRYVYVSVSEE